MKELNQYIFEKFKISKNIKNQNISKEIKDIIEDYLVSWTYLGNSDNDRECKINQVEDYKIEVYIQNEVRENFWSILGRDIGKEIKKKLNIDIEGLTIPKESKIYISWKE